MRGAASYDVQVTATLNDESSWTSAPGSSKSFTTLEGLTSGTRMYMRVRGIGKSPAGPWSEPIGKIVPGKLRPQLPGCGGTVHGVCWFTVPPHPVFFTAKSQRQAAEQRTQTELGTRRPRK